MTADDDSDDHLLKLNPSKFQKLTKYAIFYYFVIVLKIIFFFGFAIAAVRDSPSAGFV